MRAPLKILLALTLFAAALPTLAGAVGDGGSDCLDPLPPLEFDPKVFIDTDRAGGEPVAVVAHDGSISVSAHAGTTHFQPDPAGFPGTNDFAVGYFNQTLNWRSVDGGRSWEYVGLAGMNAGPHSLTSTGFSDPDYAIDQAGTIYNVEIDLVNNAVFSSRDDGQSYLLAHPEVFPGDRPWLAANEPDEVFLYVNLPRQLLRSRDGGITWTPLGSPPINGKPITDPLNPDNGLIGPMGGSGIAISADDGDTWTQHPLPGGLGPSSGPFINVSADSAGNVYLAGASGYSGPSDSNADGRVAVASFNRATGAWTVTQLDIDGQLGYAHDATWPWSIGGDEGRMAITWLGTGLNPETGEYDDDYFYLYAAYTLNGVGTDCDGDGTIDVGPQFSVANATGDAMHVGQLCTGTGCNLFGNGDRRLGDFHSVQLDHTGRIFIVSGDTTLRSVTGGPKPVANPIFVGASASVPLLKEQPEDLRPTRCVQPFDLTPLCQAGPSGLAG